MIVAILLNKNLIFILMDLETLSDHRKYGFTKGYNLIGR